ncbi:type II secretion system protein N [Caballeronia mineralivorans]|uniref:type II secretion system protein N n=1 Tax=Caballeronia mineralivorans TaxID=2010198 RepID=UPI002AFE4A82|nr:type II secretion system protein N [Caballeronia mineralivorans]MEA3097069.1 ral secretion pathway protein [Caballeronia mineralivorans]
MNALQTRLLSLIALAIFCATLTWWVITLTTHESAPLPAAAAGRAPSVEQAATLFGGQLKHQENQDVHLFGILALQHGAAAIVSYGGEPARAISLGGPLTPGVTIKEVRARSIIIERNGSRSEVFLPPNAPGPTIYVR